MIAFRFPTALVVLFVASSCPAADVTIDVGSRLKLFVDDYLIDELSHDVTLKLHHPRPREVVLTTDRPREGNSCGYFTVLRDGDHPAGNRVVLLICEPVHSVK